METYRVTKLQFIELFRKKNINFFSLSDVKKMFAIENSNTLKHLIRRLKKEQIIEKLLRNKYLFLHAKKEITEYEIANFLVQPSYVSLETALSFYGMLSQFPYRITSVTINKSRMLKVRNKIFHYSKIKPSYYKDFLRQNNYLIASRQKALFDYLYFTYKGLRPFSTLDELSSFLSDTNTKKYILENGSSKFINFLKKYVEL